MREFFLGFCRDCTSERRVGDYCGRHAWRHFEPGEECAWCGADLDHEPKRCRNQRGEAFCTPYHRSASNAALRRLLARPEETDVPGSSPD
jgi:hypothetical protein